MKSNQHEPFPLLFFLSFFWSESVRWHACALQHQCWMGWAVFLSDLGFCQCWGQLNIPTAGASPGFFGAPGAWWGFERQLSFRCQIPSCRRAVHAACTNPSSAFWKHFFVSWTNRNSPGTCLGLRELHFFTSCKQLSFLSLDMYLGPHGNQELWHNHLCQWEQDLTRKPFYLKLVSFSLLLWAAHNSQEQTRPWLAQVVTESGN